MSTVSNGSRAVSIGSVTQQGLERNQNEQIPEKDRDRLEDVSFITAMTWIHKSKNLIQI